MLNSTLMTLPRGSGWGWLRPSLLLAVIMLVGGGLRLWDLGERSLWSDELFVLEVVQLGPLELIWPQIIDRGNMLLFYGIAKLWVEILPVTAPPDEFTLRLLPASLSFVTIPALYLLGQKAARNFMPRISGDRVGLFAAGFYALSPFAIRYAQEFRAYSLQLLLLTLASLSLVNALQRREGTHHAVRWWVAFGVLSALAMYAHFLAAMTLIAQLLGVLALLIAQRSTTLLRGLAIACGAVAAITAPLVLTAISSDGSGLSWIDPLTWFSLFRTAGFLMGTSVGTGGAAGLLAPAALTVPVIIVFGVGIMATLRSSRPQPEGFVIFYLPIMIPILIGIIVSVLVRPIWVDRYFIQVLIPVSLVFAMGASVLIHAITLDSDTPQQQRRPVGVLAVALAGTCLAISSLITLTTYKTEDWKSVAATIDEKCPVGTTMRIGYAAESPKLQRSLSIYGVTIDAYLSRPDVPEVAEGQSLCLITLSEKSEGNFSQYLERLATEIGPLTEYPGAPAVYHFRRSAP